MKIRIYNLAIFVITFFLCIIGEDAGANTAIDREYQIKAAFLYNFLKFVDWPQENSTDDPEPIVIGILGKAPLEDAFKPIEDKQQNINGRPIIIKYFKHLKAAESTNTDSKDDFQERLEAIKKCNLLFISVSQRQNVDVIVNAVKVLPILTVGESPGFIEHGGIINFVLEDEKVRFEINVAAAQKVGVKIRSQLLRLAKRVIEEDRAENKPKSSGGVKAK